MDFNSIASSLAEDFGLSKSRSDNSIDDLAKQLADDHDIKLDVKPAKKDRIYISPIAPPISGTTKEQSDIINTEALKKPIYTGGPQGNSLVQVPVDAGNKALEDIKSAASQGKEGLTDVFSGKPASGIGKVGQAALTAIGTPSDVVGNVGANLTGSENIGNRLGFIAGMVPVAKAGKVASDLLPRNKAINDLIQTITSEGRDPQALVDTVKAMKNDPRIGPVDVNPAVQSAAQKLFVNEGDAAKNYLYNASKDRVANLPQDVQNAYNAAGGVPVNVVQKLADLGAAAKEVGEKQINPILANAKPVNISNTLDKIDEVLKPGVLKVGDSIPLTAVKKELANIRQSLRTSKEYNANDLHKFQSGLRTTATNMLNSADGNTRAIGYELSKVRNNLVNDIEVSAPGYKKALNSYRDEKNIAEAFRHAHDDIFSKSTAMENAPEMTEKWFNNLSEHEKEAAKEGARLAVRSRMGVADNQSLAGTNFARSEYNQEKLKTIFGKEETEKLLRDLENTRAIKNSDQKIVEGSQTAMRLANDKRFAMPERKESNVVPYVAEGLGALATGYPAIGTALYQGSKLLSKGKNAIAVALKKEQNLHFAKMALPVQGPEREQLIRELENAIPAPKPSILSRVARLPISP